ncbi:hypothetical protein EON63_06705 [archaeon]|nr:MAG: hypothetical protein EON63_06705 [archaeon]
MPTTPQTRNTHILVVHVHIHHAIYLQIITGSFDKTCKLWNAESGQLLYTYRGHATEIVCLSFNPHGTSIATGMVYGCMGCVYEILAVCIYCTNACTYTYTYTY